MTVWNVLQIVVGLLIVYGLGLASGIALGRSLEQARGSGDDLVDDQAEDGPRRQRPLRAVNRDEIIVGPWKSQLPH